MQGTVQCPAARIVPVHSTAEVVTAVRAAIADGQHVKAAINGWQGSNDNSCVSSGGVQLNTSPLNNVLTVDRDLAQVTVQPGIKLWDFNKLMHEQYGLTLPVTQEYAEVTLGGMLGNATHGSSLQEHSSSIQDSVVRVRLVDGLGELRTIMGPDLDFIAGNLGVLGVITEMTLQLQPAFKVRAEITTNDDEDLDNRVLSAAAASYAVNITWFPGQKRFIVAAFDKVTAATPGEAHNGQTETDWLSRTLFPPIFKYGNIVPGAELMCFLEKQRYEMKAKSYFTEKFAQPVAQPVGWAHAMTSFVCREHCPLQELPYVLEEIAIPLQRLPDFIRQARTLFTKTGACLPLNGVYFRFGRASRGAIAMAGGRDTAYVGMEYVLNPIGDHYPHDYGVIQELEQILIKDYEGRPHWGKNQDAVFAAIQTKYPRWQEFEAFRQRLDPHGVFFNGFYQRRLTEADVPHDRHNCVVNSSCYCREDQDCPPSYQCGPGLIDPSTRICRRH
jgi:FAD/FMN-containing dehydrogenase